MKVTLIDYGAGNVTSVERALQRLGAASQRSSSPECIAKAEALLLPGVGHYAALIRALDERALRAPLLDAIRRGVPFLGVCLGLQALYGTSEVLKIDGEGRVILTDALKSHAGIADAVAFAGLGHKFQIWEPERFRAQLAEATGKVRALKKQLGSRVAAEEPHGARE